MPNSWRLRCSRIAAKASLRSNLSVSLYERRNGDVIVVFAIMDGYEPLAVVGKPIRDRGDNRDRQRTCRFE